MAHLKRGKPIKARLDESVDYACDPIKATDFYEKIDYAFDSEKTEKHLYTSVINCDSVDTAYAEMLETKQKFRKLDKRLGYHFIQSFHPDEPITPEEVHKIGVRLAEEFFGERYQVAIGTHLNKDHLHNHFVINSVSFVDGIKYRDKTCYLQQLRNLSDKLCLEYGFSVIKPKEQSSTEPYVDRKDRENRIPPRNDTMRADIDACICRSLTFEDFMANLKRIGYSIPRYGPNIAHMSIRAPGADRARRLDDLDKISGGEAKYSEEAIRRRIAENTPEMVAQAIEAARSIAENGKVLAVPRVVRVQWNGKRKTHKKLKGLQARYYRILYTFGMIRSRPRTQANRSMYFSLYDQLRQFDGYIRQMKLLSTCNVKTVEELSSLRESSINEISALVVERRSLYRHPDNADGGLKEQIDKITVRVAELRRIVRDCDAIEARSEATIDRMHEAQRQNTSQRRKNMGVHEQQR